MSTIVCVLKSGVWKPRPQGEYSVQYGPRHVTWLRDQFAAQLKVPHRFVCMTDIEVPGVETLPLQDDLPGWWSKLEIFRQFTKACYVDLDTVIVGDVSRYLFADHQFTVSRGIHLRKPGAINSSVMGWNGDYRFLYEQFMADKDRIMREYTCNDRWGDQAFIRDAARGRISFRMWQEWFPGAVVSYKHQIKGMDQRPPRQYGRLSGRFSLLGPDWMQQPRIVLFNSETKPWHVSEPWIPVL